MTGRWFRDIYRDAVWESEELNAYEKAVAETYARHARDKHGDKNAVADLAWLTYERLMAKAGIGRRAKVSAVVVKLVEKGWLTVVQKTSRRATLYQLTIPVGSSEGGTTEQDTRSSDGGTTVVPKPSSGSSTFAAGSSDGGTQPLGPLENPPSVQREMPTKQASRQKADAEGWRMLTVLRNYSEAEAKYLIEALTLKHGIYSDKWWRTTHGNETLDDRIEEVIAEYRENHAASQAASAA